MEKYLAADNLPRWLPIHHFNEPVWNYKTGLELVDWKQPSLYAFVAMTAFNPIFWNAVARNEYRNKTITKIVQSPYVGCYILAASIFGISGFRDHLYLNAVKAQPALAILDNPLTKAIAVALFASGQIFVLSSMWALGVTGTYLGDYFGILMTHRVTGFPFNVLNDPMYIGSFMTHLGTAMWFQSPVGILLSYWVLVVYLCALKYEGPFTDMIYSAAHKKSAAGPKSPAKNKPTGSAPTTPRKSSRLSGAASANNTDSEPDSYASAAAQPRGRDGLPSATPRRSARVSQVVRDDSGSAPATPGRMTRSRSKGRNLGSDEE